MTDTPIGDQVAGQIGLDPVDELPPEPAPDLLTSTPPVLVEGAPEPAPEGAAEVGEPLPANVVLALDSEDNPDALAGDPVDLDADPGADPWSPDPAAPAAEATS